VSRAFIIGREYVLRVQTAEDGVVFEGHAIYQGKIGPGGRDLWTATGDQDRWNPLPPGPAAHVVSAKLVKKEKA
jgi:hypothetical protein